MHKVAASRTVTFWLIATARRMIQLALVVPTYNESSNVSELVERLERVLVAF